MSDEQRRIRLYLIFLVALAFLLSMVALFFSEARTLHQRGDLRSPKHKIKEAPGIPPGVPIDPPSAQ